MIHGGVAGGGSQAAAGHSAKHTRSRKHAHGKAKHNPKGQKAAHHHRKGGKVHTVAKHPSPPRGLAIGDLLPVCSLEAVAMSLRLAGQPVSDDEVVWLWELSGRRELSIAEALEAFGLASLRLPSLGTRETAGGIEPPGAREGACGAAQQRLPTRTDQHRTLANLPLILGVDLPGPHAVLAVPGGWWSWGKLWTPWTTAVSEAWEVSWA